jgi:hypothetical protein
MRLPIAVLVLLCLPLVTQSGDDKKEEKKKPVKVADVLDVLPAALLSENGKWSSDDLGQANVWFKKNSPGHKMVIQLHLVTVSKSDTHIALSGPVQILDYEKIKFRGRDLTVKPHIHLQTYLAMPLSDADQLLSAKKGQTVKLIGTTALVTLTNANAEIYFDANLGKSKLLQVLPVQ